MKFSITAVVAALALANDAAAETILGAFIFHRHGDRLAKPTTTLTTLGAHQLLNSGKFYHDRYFDPSSDFKIEGLNITYHESQFTAQAPNSDVIQNSQYAFFQGLYPPLGSLDSDEVSVSEKEIIPLSNTLANGSELVGPLDGFQYIVSQGVDESEAPDSIWIKGDETCPSFTNASNAYYKSDEFLKLNASTYDFYQNLSSAVGKGVPKWKLNYQNAYTVFDYINVNRIHNGTFANLISNETFDQVRYLQDLYTTRLNYNATNSNTTIGGQTLLSAMFTHLNESLVTKSPLLTLFTGSYDTFSQFFGLAGLIDQDPVTFGGLVNYGASIVLELFQPNSSTDAYVRFMLRNGTETTDELVTYNIFGQNSSFLFTDFEEIVNKNSIGNLEQWCNSCEAWTLDLCSMYTPEYTTFSKLVDTEGSNVSLETLKKALQDAAKGDSSLSLAGAGGIGAGVTIGVFLIAGLLFFAFRKFKKSPEPVLPVKETSAVGDKVSIGSSSTR